MIKAILFDLDGTLYDYDTADGLAYQNLLAYGEEVLGIAPEVFDEAYKATMKEVEGLMGIPCAILHDRYLRYQLMLEKWHKPICPHVWRMVSAYYDTFLQNMHLFPGVEETLHTLKEAGFLLGIGTNMLADYQIKKLEVLGISHYFSFLVTSEETLLEKPEEKFFARCVQKAGFLKEECLFIGDNPTFDAWGARQAGLPILWFAPSDEKAAKHPEYPRLKDFRELPQILAIKNKNMGRIQE